MQEYLTHSEAETEQAGADFARALPDGKVVAMNTRYSRQTGWVYTMRAYDCENGKLFTLGSGETFEEMQVYRPDTQWGQLIQGSSAMVEST